MWKLNKQDWSHSAIDSLIDDKQSHEFYCEALCILVMLSWFTVKNSDFSWTKLIVCSQSKLFSYVIGYTSFDHAFYVKLCCINSACKIYVFHSVKTLKTWRFQLELLYNFIAYQAWAKYILFSIVMLVLIQLIMYVHRALHGHVISWRGVW